LEIDVILDVKLGKTFTKSHRLAGGGESVMLHGRRLVLVLGERQLGEMRRLLLLLRTREHGHGRQVRRVGRVRESKFVKISTKVRVNRLVVLRRGHVLHLRHLRRLRRCGRRNARRRLALGQHSLGSLKVTFDVCQTVYRTISFCQIPNPLKPFANSYLQRSQSSAVLSLLSAVLNGRRCLLLEGGRLLAKLLRWHARPVLRLMMRLCGHARLFAVPVALVLQMRRVYGFQHLKF